MRLLVAETADPRGAMPGFFSPDLTELGHEVWVLPTQEAVTRLGVAAYRRLVVGTVRAVRPALLIVHPPYDHLSQADCHAIRRVGCRTVAFAFDDPIVFRALSPQAQRRALADLARSFDLYATTDPETAARGPAPRVVRLRWAGSLGPFVAAPDGAVGAAPAGAYILVPGRAYARRVAWAGALAAAGLPVRVCGAGWDEVALPEGVCREGHLAHAELCRRQREAALVVTTADWEAEPVPMVKFRLLEAAFAGAAQVAQWSPDLADYFPATEVPAFRDATELVALCRHALAHPGATAARARAAHARASREHRWTVRFGELLARLHAAVGPLAPPCGRPRPPTAYLQFLMQTATELETRGDPDRAQAFFALAATAHERTGAAKADALLGLTRTAYARGARAAAADTALAALAALAAGSRPTAPRPALRLPTDEGRGLGVSGDFVLEVEAWAFRLLALAESGQAAAALAAVASLTDPDTVVGVAALVALPAAEPARSVVRALYARALAARPRARHRTQEAFAPLWRAASGEGQQGQSQ